MEKNWDDVNWLSTPKKHSQFENMWYSKNLKFKNIFKYIFNKNLKLKYSITTLNGV